MQQPDAPNAIVCRKAMIQALGVVANQLPAAARQGLLVASATDDSTANEHARVSLWESIAGREQTSEPDVLAARMVICVLHPSRIADDPQTCLEYFIHWYRALGLPEHGLASVLACESRYHQA